MTQSAAHNPTHRNGVRRRRGAFTLVELVVCITVSAVICGMAGSLLWNATRMRSEAGARAELIDIAARGMEQILRYAREIPQDAGLVGEAQITTAGADDLRWDVYGFRKTGATIEMTTNSGTTWRPVVKEVTALTFSYYDKTGAALGSLPLNATNRQAVRLIKVNFTVARSIETLSLQSSIYLRAFMNEVTQP